MRASVMWLAARLDRGRQPYQPDFVPDRGAIGAPLWHQPTPAIGIDAEAAFLNSATFRPMGVTWRGDHFGDSRTFDIVSGGGGTVEHLLHIPRLLKEVSCPLLVVMCSSL